MVVYTWRVPWRPDEVHSWVDLDAFVNAWWQEERDQDRQAEPAHDFQWHRFDDAAPDSVEILDALIQAAPDDYDLGSLGAGILEDLLSHFGHGAQFIDQVETRCGQESRWRRAMAGVWLSGDVPGDVRRRLAKFGATDLTGEYRRAQPGDE